MIIYELVLQVGTSLDSKSVIHPIDSESPRELLSVVALRHFILLTTLSDCTLSVLLECDEVLQTLVLNHLR